jgi:hypothetical protein
MRARPLSIAVLFLAASPMAAGAIEPEPIPSSDTTPTWEGPQFVQADRAGHVFFFRGNSFEVYPVTKAGSFGDPTRLEATAAEAGLVHNAVLSPGGDQWLVYADFSVRRFMDGKEKPVPALEWNPWGVGFLRDIPLVAVIPRPLGRVREIDKTAAAPWFLKLTNDRWDLLLSRKGETLGKALASGGMNDAIAESAVFFTSDRQGRLWAARQYSYRVQQFSPGGRALLEITVDGGGVRKRGESKGIEIQFHGAQDDPVAATKNPRAEKGRYFPFTAEPVILALTEGHDGRFYFLVQAAGEAALDRYDPGRAVLERVPLRLKVKGAFTIAAGRDALYLATWRGETGRWRISWDTLEQAQWKAVEGARIDGFEAAPDGSAAEKRQGKAVSHKPGSPG